MLGYLNTARGAISLATFGHQDSHPRHRSLRIFEISGQTFQSAIIVV